MHTRKLTAVALAVMMASGPAFAAGTTAAAPAATTAVPKAATMAPAKTMGKTRYYIVQATDTKACSIVTAKPDGKTATMVGKYWYATMAKATAAEKHAAACKSA